MLLTPQDPATRQLVRREGPAVLVQELEPAEDLIDGGGHEGLCVLVTRHPRGGVVRVDHPAGRVLDRDAVGSGPGDDRELLPGQAQLPLGQPLLGDVASDRSGADDPAGAVTDGGDRQRDVDRPAVLGHALGGEVLDALAAGDTLQDGRDLVLAVGWGQRRDRVTDDLLGPVPVHALRARSSRTRSRRRGSFGRSRPVTIRRSPRGPRRARGAHPPPARSWASDPGPHSAIVHRFPGRIRQGHRSVTRAGPSDWFVGRRGRRCAGRWRVGGRRLRLRGRGRSG